MRDTNNMFAKAFWSVVLTTFPVEARQPYLPHHLNKKTCSYRSNAGYLQYFSSNQKSYFHMAKNIQEVFWASFKRLFKAFTLLLAHLFYGFREIVTATKTPYRTKWPMCKEPDPYPRNKQEANCLSTHSLQLIFTSVHSLRSTLENKVSPFVCMEAQRYLLEVISMTSIVVTPHKVKESPIASSREVVPFLSYFPQYGS